MVDNLQAAVYNSPMNVTALGEFGLIADLARIVSRASPDLLVGIGDDAAVWTAPSTPAIATTDILIEDVHFTLGATTWFELGWKALAVNLSDIAAMGGEPRFALLSLALPPSTEVASVEELYRGVAAVGDRFGTIIAGGDTVRSPQPVVVSVTVAGAAREIGGQVRLLRRSVAQVGDIVGVTGTLGGSAGGLAMLLQGLELPPAVATALREAHLKPVPRVPEAQVLLATGVEAAMDISDGLVGDLQKMCLASGMAAVVDPAKVAVQPALRAAFPDRALDMALYGGEDYELLFCAAPRVFAVASDRLRDMGLAAATVVGEIVAGPPGKVWLRDEEGRLVEPAGGGYDAFAR